MTSRRLAQLFALALFVLTYWTVVSRPGVIGDEFVGMIYAVFLLVTAVAFGVAFMTLRVATIGSANFWTTGYDDQVRPIWWMILTVLGVMCAVGALLHLLGQSNPASSEITYLLAGTLVPALFVHCKLIQWPERLRYASWPRLLLIGAPAICVALAWSHFAYLASPERSALPEGQDLISTLGALIIGGTLEEVLFRVFLLTALVGRTGSRVNAVFLSSIAFGLMHIPGTLLNTVMHGDWSVLWQVAFDYAPGFLLQTALGLFLGVIWLQTGSITLIALLHALLNLGNALATGLLAYG
ncbi:lysostaphin resistance A-like protein [Brevundimonas sp.]|uniref:CPBP family intramembrane glutamic endopeptidase n=1 Tax=Brevundimonas sp. TaxID=1871086 RepID=UPI003F70CBFA